MYGQYNLRVNYGTIILTGENLAQETHCSRKVCEAKYSTYVVRMIVRYYGLQKLQEQTKRLFLADSSNPVQRTGTYSGAFSSRRLVGGISRDSRDITTQITTNHDRLENSLNIPANDNLLVFYMDRKVFKKAFDRLYIRNV